MQLRSVTEIAPISLLLCVNRSPTLGYGFGTGAKSIRYSMNTYPICDSPLWKSARRSIRFVTEIAPISLLLCVNRSPTLGYGFGTGAKSIRYSMNTYPICDSPLWKSVRRSIRAVTEMAPKSPFLCVNRSPI